MKIKYIIITIVSLLSFHVGAVTLQNNFLCIYRGDVEDFRPNQQNAESFSVGQPWGGAWLYAEDGRVCLNVLAGRHKSKPPREWVQNGIEHEGLRWSNYNMKIIPQTAGDDTPDELNFAFVGTLKFTLDSDSKGVFVCNNVHIGGGSSAKFLGVIGENNWWFFNNKNSKPDCDRSNEHLLTCFDEERKQEAFFKYSAEGSMLKLKPFTYKKECQ